MKTLLISTAVAAMVAAPAFSADYNADLNKTHSSYNYSANANDVSAKGGNRAALNDGQYSFDDQMYYGWLDNDEKQKLRVKHVGIANYGFDSNDNYRRTDMN
tara:strand:+ start:560 stop:865 length:306 start_codon:yes stop_codon:yes gene_type:complete